MKNLHLLSTLMLSLLSVSCFRSTSSSNGTAEWLQTTTPKEWTITGNFNKTTSGYIALNEMMLYNNQAHLVVSQTSAVNFNTDGAIYHKMYRHDGENWKLLTSDYEEKHTNLFTNLRTDGVNLFRIYGWHRLQSYSNGTWVDVIGETGYSPAWPKQSTSYNPNLQFDNNRKPYIVFADGDCPKDNPSGEFFLSAATMRTGSWQWMGERGFHLGGSAPKVETAENGTPHLMFVDFDPARYEQDHLVLSMMQYKNNKWEYLGNRGFNPGAVDIKDYSFKIYQNTPYVFLRYTPDWTIMPVTEQEQKIALLKFENNKWNFVGALECRDAPSALNLAFTQDGSPVVAYIDDFHFVRVLKFTQDGFKELGNLGSMKFDVSDGESVRSYSLSDLKMSINQKDDITVVYKQRVNVRDRTRSEKSYYELWSFKYTGSL